MEKSLFSSTGLDVVLLVLMAFLRVLKSTEVLVLGVLVVLVDLAD